MFHGCFPRTGRARLLAFALAGLLAGCSGYSSLQYESYPTHLKYPSRADLLVKEAPSPEPRHLDPPGQLDESIRKVKDAPKAKMYDPADLKAESRAELARALDEVFGTPARPRVGPAEGTDAAEHFTAWRNQVVGALPVPLPAGAIEDLELDEKTLQRGSKLYRRHCLHCHGLPGDGRGPTGPWVHPHPRDYRSGVFKFISTAPQPALTRKPRRDDLFRVLHQGIDGTSMPAFGLLPEYELRYLASYVTHLSIRGQVEFDTMSKLLADEPLDQFEGERKEKPSRIADHVYSQTAQVLIAWARSNAPAMAPPPYTPPEGSEQMHASIRAGHKLFLGKGACIGCHHDYGRQVPYRYDAWGTLVRPRNLTEGNYRGGRRPIDLFWRIKGGIPGTGMSEAQLNDEEYWQLVNFVKALPYPAMLPDDVRQAVYGGETKRSEKQASAK